MLIPYQYPGATTVNNTDEISEAQRRRIAAEERRGQAYMGHALAELDDAGGRYATVTKRVVTGAIPRPTYPTQPAGSPWASEPIGPEPPTGYAIDEMEPVGEMFERAAPAPSSPGGAGVGGGPSTDTGRPTKFKRRF